MTTARHGLPQRLQRKPTTVVVSEIRRRMASSATPLLIALDGGSGAGKSSLATSIAAELGASVVEGDDFFVNDRTNAEWDAYTPAERAALCIDWRRLRAEALEPLLAGRAATWHPCDFARLGRGLAAHLVSRAPTAVIMLDGAYSCRPELSDLIDLSILVDTPAAVRYRRRDARESTDEAAWHARWDPAENYYFSRVRPASSFDLVVTPVTGEVHSQ